MSQLPDSARIGIVMLSAIGDAVHVLPVVNALRRSVPASHISWILEPAASRLVTGHPAVDEFIVHRKGTRALMDLRKRMRDQQFDLVIDLQVALKAGLATAVLPARRKLGFDRTRARDANWLFTNDKIPAHAQQHVQDQYFEFLHHLGVSPHPLEWNLGPWQGEKSADAILGGAPERPLVGLVLATTWDEKDWFADRWTELATVLYNDFGLQPVLIGGKSDKERDIAAVVERGAQVPLINTLGCTLRELVAVLDACALVVSPDTAPLHMSVALDVPVVALMGYTNPRRVGPYKRFQDLLVDAYGNPGEEYAPSLEYRDGRMQRIAVSDVVAKVALWRDQYAALHD